MSNPTNPSVANRSDSKWWTAPIGVGTVETSPVFMNDLPIADPHVVGQLYNLAGTIKESAG